MNDPTPLDKETVDPSPVTPATFPIGGEEEMRANSPLPSSGTEPRPAGTEPQPPTVAFHEEDTSSETSRPLAIPGYEILEEIGHGGMGVVYKAREIALDRLVALKMVTAGAHAHLEQRSRFRAEARAEARVQHPHIVQIHAAGEHEGCLYLSLEYMDGGSLAQKIARRPQPPLEAAQLVHRLALAMHSAHQRGILHRDLKPANVLLARDGTAKIADFGLAKLLDLDTDQTRTGSLMGTPNYMSPEQAEGRKDIGPATDIWALGAILYELLVGRTPFQGVTTMDTLEQAKTREPVPPMQLQPNVPSDLETICLKCLRKEPEKRYVTAEALADDLGRFLAGEPIRARPVGSLERLTRWCRRNPRLAGLSAAVLVLLVTVAATSTAFAFLLDARQRETQRAREKADANASFAHEQERRADDNAREALDRYELALEALQVLIDKVQRDLKTIPEATQARRGILEAAIVVLRRAVERKDSSGLPRRSLASAHMIMGDILLEQNQPVQAVEHYNQCHAILETLYKAAPDSDKAAGNFSVSLARQGDLALDIHKNAAEAKDLYRRALRIQQDLLAHPLARRELRPEEVRRITANSFQRLGEITLRDDPNNLIEAEEHFQKAQALLEEVIRVESNTVNQQKLADVSFKLAVVNEKLNRPALALRAYDSCLAMRQKLVEDNPTQARCKWDLIDLCGKVGDQALFRGDTASAQRYYRSAIVPNEQLAASNKQPGTRKLLGLNYYRLATACLRLGESAQAEANYRKCLDVRVQLHKAIPNHVGIEIELMLAQARCGLHAEAAAYAEKLRQRSPKDPNLLLQAACGYALSIPGVGRGKSEDALTSEERALRGKYRDRALEVLRQARANGYKDVKNLQVEPDLDPLRRESEFQSLLHE